MTETKILTHEERRQQFIESGWLVSIPLATIPAHWLYSGENRLDGGFYTAEVTAALRIVNDCGHPVKPLADLADDIFILDRFRRIYASDKKSGWAYLSASETLDFRPDSERYIAKDHAPKLAKLHFAKTGWILVSSSGTVGRMTIATDRLTQYFLTHDLIRVIPKETHFSGYIYAFLSSKIGQALISKDQYGSAVKHLEPHHIAKIPVPLLPEKTQIETHTEIMKAFALRDEANYLLDEADRLLHKNLDLPYFDESLVPYLPAPKKLNAIRENMPHPKAFSLKASNLQERFDASFHVPMAQTVVNFLKKGKYPPVQLTNFVKHIFIPTRFKRIYVPKEYGVPFLQGSHLPQMRPYDLKFLSLKANAKHINECLIHSGYVLVTRSGTIGRIGLVTSSKNDWGASEHILRIVPDDEKTHSGFIAAFLMTPYGQHQLQSKIYGGVVDEITEEDTGKIWIPDAPEKIQIQIGELVKSAFEKKDEASKIEEAAIAKVESLLNAVRS
jgi:type I restriction enzyme, S subunit